MTLPKGDQRREAGMRTRARLMDVAMDLLADRGKDGISLRAITTAAEANVSAVSYHFGSLRGLFDAAIEDALEHYLDAQQEAVGALSQDASLEDLAEAFARPMITALTSGGRDLALMRIVARTGIDPPEGWLRLDSKFDQIRAECVRVLKVQMPKFKAEELILRTRLVAGMLNWMVLAPLGAELRGRSRKHLEEVVLPALAGAFGGGNSHHAPRARGIE
jgi:AcrR family transcriptional regulator